MAKCVQCGSKIKNDASFCPVCGCRNPLDKKERTNDYTLAFEDLTDELKDYNPKKAGRACLLACLLGFCGIQYKYLENKKMMILSIVWSVLSLAFGFLLGYFTSGRSILLAIVVGVLLLFAVNICDGLSFLLFKRKDGHGEDIK